MTRPGFFEGVAVAALASVIAGLLHALLPLLFLPVTAGKLIALIISGGYLLYLLARTTEPAGRLTTLLIWSCLATVLWLSGLSSGTYLAGHLAMLWLVRALYYQAGPLSAAIDGLLMLVGLVLGTGAYLWAGSLFAAVWTFFLTQALFVLIPDRRVRSIRSSRTVDSSTFESAYRSAEAALNKLSTHYHL